MRDFTTARDYRRAARLVRQDRDDALKLLRYCEVTDGVTLAHDCGVFVANRRVTFVTGPDEVQIGCHPASSWAMEYRQAVCILLACTLRDYWREQRPLVTGTVDLPLYDGVTLGEWLRRRAVREFGVAVGNRWFN